MVRDTADVPLDEDDIAFLKTYGIVPYSVGIKKVEKDIQELAKKINDLCRIKESDTGLAPRNPAKMVRFIDDKTLDEDDIALLKTNGLGPYSAPIKKMEKEIKDLAQKINDLCGIKESDTGLAPPSTSMGSRIR